MPIVITLFILILIPACMDETDWTITPGVSVGEIAANSSEMTLVELFGKQNVKSATIDLGEGETAPGTVLFPDEQEKTLEILWKNWSAKSTLKSVFIKGQRSKWITKSGISLGTSLKQLEQINGKPFTLGGFDWDGSGAILDFNGGKLCSLGYCDDSKEGIDVPRKIYISVNPIINDNNKSLLRQVVGDRIFLSSHPVMQQLNPTVNSITVRFDD